MWRCGTHSPALDILGGEGGGELTSLEFEHPRLIVPVRKQVVVRRIGLNKIKDFYIMLSYSLQTRF